GVFVDGSRRSGADLVHGDETLNRSRAGARRRAARGALQDVARTAAAEHRAAVLHRFRSHGATHGAALNARAARGVENRSRLTLDGAFAGVATREPRDENHEGENAEDGSLRSSRHGAHTIADRRASCRAADGLYRAHLKR